MQLYGWSNVSCPSRRSIRIIQLAKLEPLHKEAKLVYGIAFAIILQKQKHTNQKQRNENLSNCSKSRKKDDFCKN